MRYFLACIPRTQKIEKEVVCITLSSAELNTIARIWKKHKCQKIGEGMRKWWWIYRLIEYYTAVRKDETLKSAANCAELGTSYQVK